MGRRSDALRFTHGILTEGMDMAFEQGITEVAQVRIPADLNAQLDEFFSSLKLRILEEAVLKASIRTGTDPICVLHREELVETAQVALAEAAAELDDAFAPREFNHVRRAS